MKSVITRIFAAFLLLFTAGQLLAYDVPKKPEGNTRYINDYANLLSLDEENLLNYKLQKYWDSTSTDLVVVTLETLNGEDPFDVGLKIYNTWGIGTEGKDNGVLLLIAYENDDPAKRKIQFITGQGAEGFLPDGVEGSLIRNTLAPAFKEKKYGIGIDAAIDEIIARSKGVYKNEEKGPKKKFPIWLIIMIVILIISFMGRNSGPGSRTYGGGGLLGPAMWGGWGAGLGGGSSGGGGGWSGGFGGGMSGGGGAGGSW
ncbi:MAG: TPM domain-containing protein [Bacteroidia bacterium]